MFVCVCVCQPGEEFYAEDCTLKCRCDAPFITCMGFDCPPAHECKLVDGDLGCHPDGKCTKTDPLDKWYVNVLTTTIPAMKQLQHHFSST